MDNTQELQILLLGATGGTGFEVLKRLVQEKYKVKVVARSPKKLDLGEIQGAGKGQIEVVQGDVFKLDQLTKACQGCDAVISALGTGKENKYTELYSEGGRNILAAMRACEIKRLITVTSGAIDMSDPSTDNFFMNRIIRPNFNKVYYDQTRWETVLDDTEDIDWTCVRPTYLRDKNYTGEYRVKERHCPKGGRKIGRADLAEFIVKQLKSDEFIHLKPVLAY